MVAVQSERNCFVSGERWLWVTLQKLPNVTLPARTPRPVKERSKGIDHGSMVEVGRCRCRGRERGERSVGGEDLWS